MRKASSKNILDIIIVIKMSNNALFAFGVIKDNNKINKL